MNLDKTYSYKRKFNLNLSLGFVYLVLPALGDNYGAYSSAAYYMALVIVEGLILAHILGKKFVISEAGIANLIFWKLPLWSVVWQDLEEMSAVPVLNKQQTGSQEAMEPFAVIQWIAGVSSRGFRVKLIVTHSEAVYLNLSAIENGDEIYDLLKSKVREVRG